VREVGAHALAAAAAFAVITVLHIVFGELAAKSVALWRPEGTAMVVVPPTNLFLRAFWPAIRLLNGLANGALGLFGLKAPSGHHVYSSEEIRMLVTESQRHGAVEPDEAQLVHRAFRFGERTAVEVMVPRVAVRGVPLGSTVRDAVAAVREAGYTRLPVYEESLDAIRGMVHTKDLMLALADGRDDEPIERSLRPVLAVPGTKLVVDLLDEMRDQRRPLAVILDEYGGTAGIVTLEDLLEEIVGEIPGEFRQERRLVHLRQPNRIVVDAAIPLEELNEMLGTALPTEHANTLGGFLFHRLGAVPERGRSVEEAGLVFTVLSASRTRIETVEIRRASG
jgi:CBS domain containing-hemolysin-like protein